MLSIKLINVRKVYIVEELWSLAQSRIYGTGTSKLSQYSMGRGWN
jgi:hypothetical protein